jgi:hypothetical protein
MAAEIRTDASPGREGRAPVVDRATFDAPSRPLWPILVALALGPLLVWLLFGERATNFEEVALGEANTSVFADYRGERIHCEMPADAEQCLAPARARDLPRQILWLGNSQLNAINQYVAGERPAPILLAERLRPRGVDVLTFSQPNASLQEHYVLFEYLTLRYDDFGLLLLPLVFDDTRETGLRDAIAEALDDPAVRARLQSTQIGVHLLEAASAAKVQSATTEDSLMARSEAAIEHWLSRRSALWTARSEARGRIGIWLHELRNTVFRIKPTSKRPVLPGTYEINLLALHGLLERSRELGIEVLTYIVPLRSDVEPPYVLDQYAGFKSDVARIATAYGATQVDLEDLVPAEDWGAKPGTAFGVAQELDFMHFQFHGHQLLADAITRALAPHLP